MKCVAVVVAAIACLQMTEAMSPPAYESDVYAPIESCPEGCMSYFDGCNQCMCMEDGEMACTKKLCNPADIEEPMCLDDLELYPVPEESEVYECSEVMCAMFCENGFKQDANGCDMCECVEAADPCADMGVCAIYCEYGNVKTEDGCDTCECNPEPQFCAEGCKFYFDGCNTCTCNDNGLATCTEVFCEELETPTCLDAGKPECGPVCAIFCEYGNVMDENDCPTCECKEALETPVSPPAAPEAPPTTNQ